MSREFGAYIGGYFYDKVRNAADDCRDGRDDLTRLWGKFLTEFSDIAYAIASSEACDSGLDYPIFECIERLPRLNAILNEIDHYLRPFRDVAEAAVRARLRDIEKEKE